MNKKTIILLSALAVIIVAYLLLNRNISNTLTGSDRNFEFASTDNIDKVFLSNKATKKHATITKQDAKHWLVDGKYKVNIHQVDLLFSTLRNMRVKRPVSKNEKNTVIRDMALNATKVEIYEKGKLSKVFYVGQNTQNELATYFFMEGGKEPYVCHIPGEDAFLNVRFFTDVVAWRSKNVFSSKAEDISKIAIEWVDTPQRSFVIDNSQREPVLMSGNKTFKNNIEVNLNKIRSYLNLWENLSFEGFPLSFNAHQIDSISKTRPFLVMTLTDKQGKTTKLTVHRKRLTQESKIQTDIEGNPLPFEMENYYAFVNDNNKEMVQIQDYVFGKVMKNTDDFLLH